MVEYFVKTVGGISAIATLVSSMYGFICGAYMPISQFSDAVKMLISLLPGTYTLGILRNYYMNGIYDKMAESLPTEAIKQIKDSFDGNLYLFNNNVEIWQMFLIVSVATFVFLTVCLLHVFLRKKWKKQRIDKIND